MSSKYDPLTCPLPDCNRNLHLVWAASRALAVQDIDTRPPIDDADSVTWKVECEEGHVVLVPGPFGCPVCDDVGCPPPGCDADVSEDRREFRRRDAGRLSELLSGRLP